METFIWGFSWKKLKALEKPGLRGSYGLERTSGCFYRQDLALLRGYFTCWYLLPDALVTMCSLSPPLGYFGKHSREKGLRSFLYSKSVIWDLTFRYHSIQSLSRVRLCDPMDCSTPGLPVHHQPPEFTQTHVHWISNAIQPSHPLSSLSPAFNLPQHQVLFKRVSSSHQVARYWSFQL